MSAGNVDRTSPVPATGGRNAYSKGAKLLSVGIASTGLVTFAYFSAASHALDDRAAYGRVTLLWSVLFVVVSVLYRPIEQLLSRTIASRRARGLERGHPLRTPLLLQGIAAGLFLVVALLFRGPIQDDLFDGADALYWVLVVGVLAYAASYFARGWLAGHQYFGLYGGLVFLEAMSRLCFALAVVVGITSGQTAVALGMAAAPFVSLVVVPAAFSRRGSSAPAPAPVPGRNEAEAVEATDEALSLSEGGRFALAVFCVMVAEQTLLNAAGLIVKVDGASTAVVGLVFNVLLITRAPLQLFQAIQGSLLPHLAGLEATQGSEEFGKAIRVTVLAIAAFAAAVAVGLATIGPWAMGILFNTEAALYPRLALVLVALGMGAHLTAGTLNQAALARDRAGVASVTWLTAAALFVGWMFLGLVDDPLLRTALGYFGAAAVLCLGLTVVYRSGCPAPAAVTRSAA